MAKSSRSLNRPASRYVLCAAALVWVAFPASAAEITGRIRDRVTGEPLANAEVRLLPSSLVAVSAADGTFQLNNVPAGTLTLQSSTIGYRLERKQLDLAEDTVLSLELELVPERLEQRESVQVHAGAFGLEPDRALSLSGQELRNLASVLADDPLRAVQTLPGVTSNDDFRSEFALRGADFSRIGIYLDGILLHQPFHSVSGAANSPSLTLFNGDLLDEVHLLPGNPTPLYSDRTAGALAMVVRNGARDRFHARGAVSASNASLVAEGPLGRSRRGSWLASARKSYLQYLISRTAEDDPNLAFGFWDAQARASYDLTPTQRLTASILYGDSGLDRKADASTFGLNTIVFSDFAYTLSTLQWRLSSGRAYSLTTRGAWLDENYRDANRDGARLNRASYGEWIWNTDASWSWGSSAVLESGWSFRRVRGEGTQDRLRTNPLRIDRIDRYEGTGVRQGGYLLQQWAPLSGAVTLAAGGRLDHHDVNSLAAWTPFASAASRLWSSARLSLAWGQYAQFPELDQFFSRGGRPGLSPARASHLDASLDQRLGQRTRLRLDLYRRWDRDLFFRPLFDPRLLPGGAVFSPPVVAPWENSLRGRAWGGQIFLQRRTANGLTGWLSYSYGMARLSDRVVGTTFPADFDQRHAVTTYGSYRLRPTVNLSVRYVFGSGLPIPGYLMRAPGQDRVYLLARERNRVRLPDYHRLDWRLNKHWVRDRWQFTLFAEVINLLNRDNFRFDELRGFNSRTATARPGISRMFPILPSAGVTVEF